MQFTPFIGLSVLIHIILIVIYKTFRLSPSTDRTVRRADIKTFNLTLNGRSIAKYSLTPSYWLGLAIIVSIFTFVTYSSGALVIASAQEKHSTLNFISSNRSAFKSLLKKVSSVANADVLSRSYTVIKPIE